MLCFQIRQAGLTYGSPEKYFGDVSTLLLYRAKMYCCFLYTARISTVNNNNSAYLGCTEFWKPLYYGIWHCSFWTQTSFCKRTIINTVTYLLHLMLYSTGSLKQNFAMFQLCTIQWHLKNYQEYSQWCVLSSPNRCMCVNTFYDVHAELGWLLQLVFYNIDRIQWVFQ